MSTSQPVARGQAACLFSASLYDLGRHLAESIQMSANIKVHAARELPCDITRAYDYFRYFVLGRFLSRSVASFATLQSFERTDLS